jgi:hypothetical protein
LNYSDFLQILSDVEHDRDNNPTILRTSLYRNLERIEEFYDQYFDGISGITNTKELAGEGGGEVSILVAKLIGKVLKKEGTSAQIDITPYVKILALEYYMKRRDLLRDPTVGKVQDGVIYKHYGESYIFPEVNVGKINESLETFEPLGYTSLRLLKDNVIQWIERERSRQENLLKDLGDPQKMFAWILPANDITVASILSTKLIDNRNFVSHLYPPLGFMGVLENWFKWDSELLMLLSPVWIWKER